ncbi:hypothetical protein C0989_007902 [Termitomyces sp. Mn162]|nr:hypothetical protein C0989_007902 [Termitomyces sp. Mn162]
MSTTALNTQIATFASGCFWGTEHIFLKHFPPSEKKGIIKTTVGYTGGKVDATNPSYKLVCSGTTDHAESVKIEFDPTIISYADLVGEKNYASVVLYVLTKIDTEFFYRTHDPTTVNRQGGDIGTQYRSAIFTHDPDQEVIAKRVTEEVQARHFTPTGKKIVTRIMPAGQWWDAEDYHQLYLFKNPHGYQCPTHRLHW